MATASGTRPLGTRRIGRRRLLGATATVGVCGAAALVAPHLVPLAQQELKTLAVSELKNVEGVSLDAAIQGAASTRAAVKVIVLPVARLVAFLGSGALDVLLATLGGAHNALSFLHLSTSVLDALETVVTSWQSGLHALPIALSAYADADINSAEAYLKALRKMVS
jgi:hypothetical protein